MRASIYFFGLIIVISFISIGGCGGGGSSEGCDFNFSGIKNGPNFNNATTEWDCSGETESGQPTSGEFAFYDDGTGRDYSDLTTYQRAGCRSVNFQDEFVEGEYINLDGSKSENFLSFTRIVNDFETFLECTLTILEEDEDDFF